jgi:glyoxylase-like metal-dependent hydrolase (beta-lactamase superfamily II)
MQRTLLVLGCGVLVGVGVWWSAHGGAQSPPIWTKVAPGVFRTAGPVAGYAILEDDEALVIDAVLPHASLTQIGAAKVHSVLLTHYHRWACAEADSFLQGKVAVRAHEKSADWLSAEAVQKYWQESLPLRNSRTAYLIHPTGFDGLAFDLKPGATLQWRGWRIECIDAPGHARAQLAFLAQKANGPKILFAGGAFAEPGKLYAPYTTDWDHWTDLGLVPAAKSLRTLAALDADIVCPTYGSVLARDVRAAFEKTAAAVEEAGFLKSFERFTKDRLGNAPQYAFLAKDQAMSNGSKPWSRVSDHLFLTGNTYVLKSKDNACLLFDPWGMRSVDQWRKLQKDEKLGPLEVVMFSHAHYDHYDGVYDLPMRDTFETWTLDAVAGPLEDPFKLRAPFLDPRPVTIDRRPKDGETLTWREYRFRFHHLPGQSEYTMGVECVVDDKKCYFTADNFYHQDMFSGSGGWMGLNRAFPPSYAKSAKKVLDAAPDWVTAEHGGPFEFSAEDWRRRVNWAETAGKALDALSLTGQHLCDYNPHQVRIEPVVLKAKPGTTRKLTLVVENPLATKRTWQIRFQGRGSLQSQAWDVTVPAGETSRRAVEVTLPRDVPAGRHVFAVRAEESGRVSAADAFLAIDVE